MNQILRNLLPLTVRQEVKYNYRRLTDIITGTKFDNAKGTLQSRRSIYIRQPIMPSKFYHNKIVNITRGVTLIDKSIIGSNQNWSFWYRVNRPNVANGFVSGRNLVNGALVTQIGGGLCQLSSIVYHLALLGGLTILERHAHSIDIYEEDQRYTPLGADATVVWGYKDLRLHNPYPFPVSLEFRVEQGKLIGELNAEIELVAQQVDFVQILLEKPFVKVNTIVNNTVQQTTIYQQKKGLQVVD